MIYVANTMTATNYLEQVSLKKIEDISQATKDLIAYYGKDYTDDEMIAMDNYFEGIKAETYYSKLLHILTPFLAPNMTGAEIEADKPTANKAFFDVIQNKLPDQTGQDGKNMFNSLYGGNMEITDLGIREHTILPGGASYSITAFYEEDVTDVNNYSAGMMTNCSGVGTRIGFYSLGREPATLVVAMGASTKSTTVLINETGLNKLIVAKHSSTSEAETIVINENETYSPTTYNTENYDTTIKQNVIFLNNIDDVGNTFTFSFIGNLMTNAELQDFYTKTRSFLNSFGIDA